jgi:hypothetical protein
MGPSGATISDLAAVGEVVAPEIPVARPASRATDARSATGRDRERRSGSRRRPERAAWSASNSGAFAGATRDRRGDIAEKEGPWTAPSTEAGLMSFIYVDAIDEAVERIVERGGAIVQAPYSEGDLWGCDVS